MGSGEIKFIFPVGMFGPSDADTALDWAIRELSKAVASQSDYWPDKYGATFENATFLLHPDCGCEKAGECPWCTGCRIYQEHNACVVCADDTLTVEQRRDSPQEQQCDYSAGRGIFARFSPWTHDHARHYYDPPNFWHKPSGFRVCWYKYIGRDTATNRDLLDGELQTIFDDCCRSIAAIQSRP